LHLTPPPLIACVAATMAPTTTAPTTAPTAAVFTLIQTGCSGSNIEESWNYTVVGQTATITGESTTGIHSTDGSTIVWTNGLTYSRVTTVAEQG
jgi:hypothetical protein